MRAISHRPRGYGTGGGPDSQLPQPTYGSGVHLARSPRRNASPHVSSTPRQLTRSESSLRVQSSRRLTSSRSPRSRSSIETHDAEIAIICALPKEANAVLAVFDRRTQDSEGLETAPGDENAYTLCYFGEHPVVVAHMPPAVKGPSALAARVAANLAKTFRNIKLALVVGICGGVPGSSSAAEPVCLGDVVISNSITQYDHGKRYTGGFERKPTMKNTDLRFGAAMNQLEADDELCYGLETRLHSLLIGLRNRRKPVIYPGVGQDCLFEPSYVHKHRNTACDTCNSRADSSCEQARQTPCAQLGCEESRLVCRPIGTSAADGTKAPSIHVGAIGSGDSVMKSGTDRDITAGEDIRAFEMEGAGLVGEFPSVIVIKGVADYADSHKNDIWHPYASATAACCARAFLEQFWKSPAPIQGVNSLEQWIQSSPERVFSSQASEYVKDDGSQSAIWSVKVRPEPMRDPHFVGRHEELARLEAMYLEPGCTSISLQGLGGVGKSKLALEFAVLLQEKHPDVSVFWVQASDALTFDSDYAEIGRQLLLSSMIDGQVAMKMVVKRLLAEGQAGRWLLVIDNVDDHGMFFGQRGALQPPALSTFVPRGSSGCTLITTRDRTVASRFSRKEYGLKLTSMDKESAGRLLASSLAVGSAALDTRLTRAFLKRLAYLPLAIVQATAYITERDITLSEYVSLLDDTEENVSELLDVDFEDAERTDARNSIISTWRITFEDIVHRNDLAKQWLSLIACIDSKNIPEFFLPQGASSKQTLEARGLLTGYSFLEQRGTIFDMHNLVHLACRSWLRNRSALESWEPQALTRLLSTFPEPTHANRTLWSICLPHASRLLLSNNIAQMDARFDLTSLVGRCYFLEGKYPQAVTSFAAVVDHRSMTAPPLDLKLLLAHTELGEALERCNRSKEAMEHNETALKGYEKVVGPNDSLTLKARTNIACVKRRQHKWTEAEQIDVQVLDARLDVLGRMHRDTLSSMAELASDYRSMGLLDKAEHLLSRAVKGQETVLGQDHPQFLMTQASLASTYRFSSRLPQAEALESIVVQKRKKILGVHHPDTLRSMANLGSTYRAQGKLEDAERLEKEVLRLRLSVLGEEDSDTLTAMGNLAATYRNQKKYSEAEELDKHALEVKKRVLGPLDYSTLTTMSSLAATYRRSNRLPEADVLSKEVLKGCQRTLGESHIQTLVNMGIVASIFRREGRLNNAADLVQRIIDERTRALGPDHKLTQESRRSLWAITSQQRRRRHNRDDRRR